MSKRKRSGLDVLAALPWPAGILAGIVLFIGIRYGLSWFTLASENAFLHRIGENVSLGVTAPLAWVVLGACWLAAGFSFVNARRRRLLLESQRGIASLSSMTWKDFERVVSEAFRRRGFAVEEIGLGGADGGIDLILRKDGRVDLVQCKQWRTRMVNVSVVREMWGLVSHHKANGVKIVCVGAFTRDAEAFAAEKQIELINGERLLDLIRQVQSHPQAAGEAVVGSATTPRVCKLCGAPMIERINRATRDSFYGCSRYPKCAGTQPRSAMEG
jgi:restriction system protein